MVGLHLWGVTTKIPLQSLSTSSGAEARLPKASDGSRRAELRPLSAVTPRPRSIADTSDSHSTFSLFWTSDKHRCFCSPLPLLFDSQTKGKHKLRKSCVKPSEGRRRGGPCLSTTRFGSVIQPGLGRGQWPRQSLSDHRGDTMHPTGDPKNATTLRSPAIKALASWPRTAPTPQSPNRTFFLAEIFIFPDL